MKIVKIINCLLILSSLSLLSCKKNLEEQFRNPENYSQTGNLFGGMFSSMLYSGKLYVQDYGEYYWQLNSGTEVPGYAQISQRYITPRYAWFLNYDDLSGTNGFGGLTDNLWNNRLRDFYTRARAWAEIKNKLESVTGQQLADNKIYFSLATVMKDYAALLNVDFYDKIPYSEAFQGAEGLFFPKYEEGLDIYKSVMNELKTISEEISATHAGMSDLGKGIFAQQDIAFKGDIQKWIRYMNALRLKYAVRISGVDEAFAKTHLQDIFTKNNLPQTDLTWQLPIDNAAIGGGTWARGIFENYFSTFIPNIIMKRMNRDSALYQPGIDDPRLPVLAMPTKFFDAPYTQARNTRKYIGVSYDADAQTPEYTAGDRYYTGANNVVLSLQQNAKSMYSMATFTHNAKFPNYMTSLAETDLLLAEIALKNLANTGKAAGQHIKDAITNSTQFWYTMNQISSMASSAGSGRFGADSARYFYPTTPAASVIERYADSIRTRFESRPDLEAKMEMLMQQKYIHLNIMAPYELWAELRRTRHPFLEPMTFTTKVMKPFPERLRYPRSELQTNEQNYISQAKERDNFITPVFWVPTSKRSILPYWNNYNYE